MSDGILCSDVSVSLALPSYASILGTAVTSDLSGRAVILSFPIPFSRLRGCVSGTGFSMLVKNNKM